MTFDKREGPSSTVTAPMRLLWLGLWFGLAVGVGELLVLALMNFGLGRYLYYISAHTVWMTPLANIVIFGVLGLLLTLGRRLRPGWITPPVAIWAFSLLGFIAIAYFADDRVHDIALIVLSAGAATQATRMATARPLGFARFVKWTTPVLAAGVLVATAVAEGRVRLHEDRALGGLGAIDSLDRSNSPPNVLLIIWDTVRAHDLSAYEYRRETTPALERLAHSGVRFDQAMSTASWTLPSHASLFTGHYPNDLNANYTTPLDDEHATLAEVMAARGYVTGGFVANFGAAGWESGLARGFTRYEDFPATVGQVFVSARLTRTLSRVAWLRRLLGYHDVLGRKAAPRVSSGFLEWQSEHSDRPFFAFLNYYDAHAPYLPPGEYATRFGGGRPGADPLLVEQMNEESQWSPEMLQAEVDAYDGAISYLDDQLDALLRELEQRGVLENTLVIVTSDHGEEFGEHDMLGHGDKLYSTLVRVPLVMSLPGRIPADVTVETPVSLRNIPTTVLDVIGAGPSSFPGFALSDLWWGAAELESDPEAEPAEPVRSQEVGLNSIVLGSYHYLVDDQGNEELFDLIRDPFEQDNLVGSSQASPVLERFRLLQSPLQSP